MLTIADCERAGCEASSTAAILKAQAARAGNFGFLAAPDYDQSGASLSINITHLPAELVFAAQQYLAALGVHHFQS